MGLGEGLGAELGEHPLLTFVLQITAVMVMRMMATEWNSRPGSILGAGLQVYLFYGCQMGPGATAHRNDF